VLSFREACSPAQGLSFLPWEGEEVEGVMDLLRDTLDSGRANDVGIYIGPEGGFSVEEVEYARSRGITPVSMGKRIFRAETAGLVAAAVVLYEFGELNAR
ncbi:MAG: RsmE family RNA methyltransferase, partial [Dehalococcoidia bacterium]|nr:RsmE family RNA methyltransferase [Dehalococcoidia bacterium]